jgi:hypothetical protein
MSKAYFCKTKSKLKSRFIENLKLCNIPYVETELNTDIYKYYFAGIKNFFIPIDMIDNNVVSLLLDKSNDIRIFIDKTLSIQDVDTSRIDHYDSVKFLVNYATSNKNEINVLKYINSNIFNNGKDQRLDIAAGFIGNIETIPFNLLKNADSQKLDFKLRLFDGYNIKNKYNVGIVSELDKADILKKYKYFINIDGDYLLEAIACGTQIIDFENLKPIDISKDINNETLNISSFISEML